MANKRVTYVVDVPEHENGTGGVDGTDYAFEGLQVLMNQGHFAASTVKNVSSSSEWVIDCYVASTVGAIHRTISMTTDLGADDGAFELIAAGGVLPYTFAVPTPAQLPPGVTIESSGSVVGVATLAGTYNVSTNITDSLGAVRTRTVQFVVTDP